MKKSSVLAIVAASALFAGTHTASAAVDAYLVIDSNTSPALPTHLQYFETTGGVINPEVLFGFNPQPDPPGDGPLADLTNPLRPTITQTVTGLAPFSLMLGLSDGRGAFRYTSSGAPNSDGNTSVLITRTADGSVFQADFSISGFTGDWVSFNPQPDPPGFQGNFIGFQFVGDAAVALSLDEGHLDGNGNFVADAALSFSAVPEPAELAVLLTGLGGVAFLRVRRSAPASSMTVRGTPQRR